MNNHLTSVMVERLQRRELEAGEVLTVMRHLSSCVDCRSLSEDAAAGGAASISLVLPQQQTHLDPDAQMFPFVDGSADAATREVVESHLEDCAMCRSEVADLRTFVQASRFQPRWRRVAYATLAAAALAAFAYVGVGVLQQRSVSPAPPQTPQVAVDTMHNVPPPVPAEAREPSPAYTNARWATLVASTLERKALPVSPHIRELRPADEVLRGASDAGDAHLAPAGIVIDAVRPLFTWDAQPGRTYVVYVYSDRQEIARSEPLPAARWRPNNALDRGRTYTWQVEETAGEDSRILPAPPAPPAMFHVLGAKEHREIDDALTRHPDDHLLHAVLYAAAGMEDEAKAKLREAVAAGDRRAGSIASASRSPR